MTRPKRDFLEYLSRQGGMCSAELARALGVSKATVCRELRRGAVVNVDGELRQRWVYSAEKAQQMACLAGTNKGPRMKLNTAMAARLNPLLVAGKLSPKDALATLRDQGIEQLPSFKTLYNAIHAGLMDVMMLDLPYRACKQPKGKRLRRKAFTARGNTSIEERPAQVLERTEFGHYEIDTVVGRRGSRCVLLTICERKTRLTRTVRLNRRAQRAVADAMRRLVRDGLLPGIRSVTCDNGCEFLDQKALEKALGAKAYYAHPYSAFERGTNENTNRIIRRFCPKGTDFGKLSGAQVHELERRVNAIHRDVLGGLTATQALARELRPVLAA